MALSHTYQREGVVLYCGDWREVADDLPCRGALLLTDPPYGIAQDAERYRKNRATNRHEAVTGDDTPFDATPLQRWSNRILWGADNYQPTIGDDWRRGNWLVWDKVTRNGTKVRIAECELAWCSFVQRHRVYRHLWSGAFRDSERGTAHHPCQKPVDLMTWCVSLWGKEGVVVDPFMGSGSAGVAAVQLGLPFVGVEIDPFHYRTAMNRIGAAIDQGQLFHGRKVSRCGTLWEHES